LLGRLLWFGHRDLLLRVGLAVQWLCGLRIMMGQIGGRSFGVII
jgi:hypothetical protein